MASNKKPKKQVTKRPVGAPVEWTEEKAIELGLALIEWLESEPTNLYINRFLYQYKRLDGDLPDYLAKKYEKFNRLLDMAKKIQEAKISELAISGKLNATMSQFFLKNKHGWTDKKDIELSGELNMIFKVQFGEDTSTNDGEEDESTES